MTVSEELFAGGGEMGKLMRSLDWSQTPLGSVKNWSQSLKTSIRIILGSRYPMFVWWGQSMTIFYNDAYIPVLGQRHPQALGQPASQVWAEIWDTVGPQAEAVLREGRSSWNEELLLIMERNGYREETYFTFSYSPVANDDGGVGGVFCACTEDTHRVLSDRRLRTLRELAAKTAEAKTVEDACEISVKKLVDNSYDIPFALLYRLDSNGKQARLVSTAGTLGSPDVIEITKVTETSDQWLLNRVVAMGESSVIENLGSQFGHLSGGVWSESPNSAVVIPLTRPGQETFGFLIAGVSPLRVFDDDYKGFFDLMAGQVTAAIANAQAYEEERKRAEALAELDRAKTVFFSNVSHEFRTPLTLMLGPLEDLLTHRSEQLPAGDREQLEAVYRNSLRLLKLVNTLLDFSRIEAGRIQAVYEATDLSAFTAELASVFRSAIERAGMRLIVNCPLLPELVYVDREMWEKIVLNLLSNAFKFTFEGEIVISLQWMDNRVELAVQDTGTGIPSEEIPHLFERFHRVPGARGRTYEGSGIGLSLVQELVKLHEGTISVSSEVDRGTRFVVSVPTGSAHLPSHQLDATRTVVSTAMGASPYVEEALRWLPEAGNRQEESTPILYTSPKQKFPSGGAGSPTHFTPARILLADDNADMRDYVKRLLSQQYEVETVADGMAALEVVRRQRPDLVLTDVMMPRLDGFGLLRELRTDPTTKEIPIILLSARAGEESRVEGLEAGADDYLIKPFAARELLARVETTLKLTQIRQETTAVLREAQIQLESALLAGAVYTWRWNIPEDRLIVNAAFARLFAVDPVEAAKGLPLEMFANAIHVEDRARVLEAVNRAIATGEEYVAEYRVCNATGEERWVFARGQIEYDSAGNPVAFPGALADITDRKRAEEALRESEERFRNMAENAPFMVWVTDPTGYCHYLSQSWYDFTGQTEETGLGLGWVNAVHPDDREYSKSIFLAANSRCKAFRLEYRLRRQDGEYRSCIDAASPWFGVDGQYKGYIGSVIDISERKAAEAERDRLLQLEQATRAEAEKANRIKDEFLAVLSHELRSPLNPILGWSKLLQSRKLDEAKTAQALATIERNAKLQSELIEDLLDVSRILQGKLNLNVTPVNLATTIQAALETVRLAAEAKSIELEVSLEEPEMKQVSGDSTRLQQVVWNLLSNAVKFTSAGGRVTVRLEQFDSQAQITVSDTGKGIHPDFLPHVFDYFRQEDGKTTRKFGGLGLGLAIVRHLVELHGGTVWADSPGEGLGATFTVRLPLMPTQPMVNLNHNLLEQSLNLNGIQALVVDDEIDSREFVAFVLEQAGARALAASSAGEAFAALTRSKPDVLLSDIGMPDMDGYMLMRQIRTLPPEQGGQIPAIALTAYAGDFNQQQALQAGFQQHIAKPVEPGELIKAIVALLGRSGNGG